jgi:hypothetical protein
MNEIVLTTDLSVKVTVGSSVYRNPDLKQSPFDGYYENYIVDGSPNCEFIIGETGAATFKIYTKKALLIVGTAGATPIVTLPVNGSCIMFFMLGKWRAAEFKMLTA